MNPDVPTNSVLEVKLDYIQKDVLVIRQDVKDIKNEYVSRREFTDALTAIRDEFSPIKKFVYAIISILGLAVLGAILNLILK